MDTKDGRVVTIALSITAVILLYAAIVLYVMKENERGKVTALQKRVEEVTVVKDLLEVKMKEVEIANAELKTAIKSDEEKITALTKTFDDEQAAHGRDVARLQQNEAELKSVKAKLDEERTERDDLAKRLERLNEEYLNLKFQLENLLKTKEEMERKAKEMADKEGVSLGTIVIKRSQ